MKRVLIIDDEVDVRTLLAQRLRANHYSVMMAANGAEALFKLRKQSADFIILDLKMPEMDGIEFMKAVADEFPDSKIIVLSGVITREAILEIKSHRRQVTEVLAKPWDNDQLLQALKVAEEIDAL